MRASLILITGLTAAIFRPLVAHAQPAQFCMPQTTAQSVAAALQSAQAAMLLMQDAVAEPQRQAAAIAAAVAKQKIDDEALAKSAPKP